MPVIVYWAPSTPEGNQRPGWEGYIVVMTDDLLPYYAGLRDEREGAWGAGGYVQRMVSLVATADRAAIVGAAGFRWLHDPPAPAQIWQGHASRLAGEHCEGAGQGAEGEATGAGSSLGAGGKGEGGERGGVCRASVGACVDVLRIGSAAWHASLNRGGFLSNIWSILSLERERLRDVVFSLYAQRAGLPRVLFHGLGGQESVYGGGEAGGESGGRASAGWRGDEGPVEDTPPYRATKEHKKRYSVHPQKSRGLGEGYSNAQESSGERGRAGSEVLVRGGELPPWCCGHDSGRDGEVCTCVDAADLQTARWWSGLLSQDFLPRGPLCNGGGYTRFSFGEEGQGESRSGPGSPSDPSFSPSAAAAASSSWVADREQWQVWSGKALEGAARVSARSNHPVLSPLFGDGGERSGVLSEEGAEGDRSGFGQDDGEGSGVRGRDDGVDARRHPKGAGGGKTGAGGGSGQEDFDERWGAGISRWEEIPVVVMNQADANPDRRKHMQALTRDVGWVNVSFPATAKWSELDAQQLIEAGVVSPLLQARFDDYREGIDDRGRMMYVANAYDQLSQVRKSHVINVACIWLGRLSLTGALALLRQRCSTTCIRKETIAKCY